MWYRWGRGSIGGRSYLASLVLGDFVLSVLLAGLALAVGAAGFGNVDLGDDVLVDSFQDVVFEASRSATDGSWDFMLFHSAVTAFRLFLYIVVLGLKIDESMMRSHN